MSVTEVKNKPDQSPDAKGSSGAANAGVPAAPQLIAEVIEKLMAVRTKTHEIFGRIILHIMNVPRYKHLSIGDLQHVLLEPLIHDRIMFAQAKGADGKPDDNAHLGIAIWASVSDEVDAKIKEQIKAGVFPVRLQPKEWTSGKINWLLDVVTHDANLAAGMAVNFQMAAPANVSNVHPNLKKMFGGAFVVLAEAGSVPNGEG